MSKKRNPHVKETNSGVKSEGNWDEITDFAEEVEEVIKHTDIDTESVEEYNRWRPRKEEAENEVKKKTVEEASLKKTKAEEKSEGTIKDIEKATEEAVKAGKKVGKDKELPEKELVDASRTFSRPFISEIFRLFRRLERFIYANIMLRSDTYYLDTRDFSANMSSKKGEYQMEINVPEERNREKMKEELSEN
ncbi:MAG: DUF5828 family protein [Candidatus Aenigmatarchaeota archaeon]